MIPYTLVRSRRKTLAIHIMKDATVEVRAPLRMSMADINGFVKSRERWIEERLARRKGLLEAKSAFSLGYGDSAALCGVMYPIRAKDGNRAGFDGEGFYLPPGMDADSIKHTVVQIYRRMAKNIIASKVGTYAQRMGVAPSAVRITGAKTRWGSCSGKKSVNFSWRLVMAGDDVIDYVVVHELAHIRELNHSPRFWAVVEGVLPDYKARQKKLKQLQETLAAQDWD